MSLFGSTPKAPPPPPPPPNPPTMADTGVQAAAAKSQEAAAMAAGAGFADTIKTSPQGSAPATTTQKSLLGQ